MPQYALVVKISTNDYTSSIIQEKKYSYPDTDMPKLGPMQEQRNKISIGVTGPDLLIESGGAQNHALNVMTLLNKYYDFIYVLNPFKIEKYRKELERVSRKVDYLKEMNIRIPQCALEAIESGTSGKWLLEKYEGDLKVDYIFNFSQDFPLFSEDFTHKLSRMKGVNFGVCFQNPCIGDASFQSYIANSIRLSLVGRSFYIFLFRIYQYLRMVRVIHKMRGNDALDLVTILNQECQQNISKKLGKTRLLFPANGVLNSQISYTDSLQGQEGDITKKNQIIFFARLSYSKGLFDLLPILKQIMSDSEIKLKVVGKFDHEFEHRIFNKRMAEFIGQGKIIYTDYLNDRDFYREISESKVMIYPSHSDTYPIGVLQSLYFKTPVVAYDIPALSIYREVKAVKLVREFDFQNFSTEVIKILKMDDPSTLFTKEVMEFAMTHSWDKVAKQYKKNFESILKSNEIN